MVLNSIVPWHCISEAQWGEKDPRGIRLKEVVILEGSVAVAREDRKFVLAANANEASQTDVALAAIVHIMLRQLGLTGSKKHLITTLGFFSLNGL